MEAQLLDTETAKRAYVEEHGAGNEQALSRLHTVCGHLVAFPCSAVEAPGEQPTKTMVRKGPRTITITDSETNKTISRTRTARSRSGAHADQRAQLPCKMAPFVHPIFAR